MTGSSTGLATVARVRGVREQDSRLGLHAALRQEHEARTYVERLRGGAPAPVSGLTRRTEFMAHRIQQQLRADALAQARTELQELELLSLSAREHWRHDHVRLAAVTQLIERQETARRHERRRRDDKTMDEIGAQLWQRQRTPR